MSYNRNIQEKIEKYKAFFNDTSPGNILISISPYTFPINYSQCDLADKPLNEWDFETEAKAFIDNEVKRLRYYLTYTKELDSDFIPSMSVSLGIGLHSAYFSGTNLIMGKDTSWVYPVIKDWSDIEKLKVGKENKWTQILREMTQRIVEICEGDYVPTTFAHFGPMDMANALRGNQLFYDFYDCPDEVRRLLEISADAIIWLEKTLKKITKDIMEGSVVANIWFPGSVLFMSEDAADLCSSYIYRNFASSYTQKVINAIGGAYIHHHAKGMQVHNEIAKLAGLRMLEISWDPNCPRPIDHLDEIYEWSNGLPLQTRCTAADVYEKIDTIKKGRIILMVNVTDLNEAKEVIKFVRKHSKI